MSTVYIQINIANCKSESIEYFFNNKLWLLKNPVNLKLDYNFFSRLTCLYSHVYEQTADPNEPIDNCSENGLRKFF